MKERCRLECNLECMMVDCTPVVSTMGCNSAHIQEDCSLEYSLVDYKLVDCS
jgi:hypothetical protein